MTIRSLTEYNDNPQPIRPTRDLFTELDHLPNYYRFQRIICDGCGMPTGDVYSPGHAPGSVLYGTCVCSTFWNIICCYLSRLRTSLGTVSILLVPLFLRLSTLFVKICWLCNMCAVLPSFRFPNLAKWHLHLHNIKELFSGRRSAWMKIEKIGIKGCPCHIKALVCKTAQSGHLIDTQQWVTTSELRFPIYL